MKLVMAKQHGAWAMLIIPFILSMIVSGARWEHSLLFVTWILMYMATYPIIMFFKGKDRQFYLRWFVIYMIPAILFLIYPLIVVPELIYFGIAFIPFFMLNVYFANQKNERALTNDIIATINFGIGGLASYYFGSGALTIEAWNIFSYCFLFFLGTTFYVKTMIREKNNKRYKYLSWGFHIGLIIVFILMGQWYISLAYVSSTIRAIALYGKKLTIKNIGIIEITNATIFFFVMLTVLLRISG